MAHQAKQARESFTEARGFDDLMAGGYGILDDKGQLQIMKSPNSLTKGSNDKK